MKRLSSKLGSAAPSGFWLGVNYWSRAGGPDMWLEYDEAIVEQELRQLHEHGIGLTKKKYLRRVLSEAEIDIMKQIKKTFDPNNILNPGKIFE